MNFHMKLFHLTDVPCQQIPELSLVALRAGGDEGAAQLIALFVDNGLMAPQSKHPGSFHAADTAADDVDGLRIFRFLDVVLIPLHGLRVDGAAGQMQRVRKILIVGHALVVAHIEAAVVAQNAGPDILGPALHQLGDPGLIGQEGPGKAHAVDFPGGNGLGGRLRHHAPRADHRNIHKLLDVLHILQIAVFRHIDGRVGPVPGIIGAVVAVEHIVARVL